MCLYPIRLWNGSSGPYAENAWTARYSGPRRGSDGRSIIEAYTKRRLLHDFSSSQTAKVGDHLALTLTQDLKIGNTVVAPKAASATGTVVQVNRSGMGGAPGTLVVEPDALISSFGPIPLSGSVTKEGDARVPNATFLIPVVGEAEILRHGCEAVIAPGAFLIAFVAKDTPLDARSDQ